MEIDLYLEYSSFPPCVPVLNRSFPYGQFPVAMLCHVIDGGDGVDGMF